MSEERWEGDNLGPEDMAIPVIKLVQNVGGEVAKAADAKPGDFYCELTGEILQTFPLVIIRMGKDRTYWGRTEIDDDPPACSSLDAKSMVSINGDDCNTCEHRTETPWLLPQVERRLKCCPNYNILGINLDSDLPIMLRCTGISAMAAKQLYTQLSLNKQLVMGWFKAKTLVTSVPRKSASGDAFAIRFGKLELLPEEQHMELATRSRQLLGTSLALPEGYEEKPEELELTEEEQQLRTKTLQEQSKAVLQEEKGKLEPQKTALTVNEPAKQEEPPVTYDKEEPPIDVAF